LAYRGPRTRIRALESLEKIIRLASDYDVRIVTLHPAYYKPHFNDYTSSPHAEVSLDYYRGFSAMLSALKELVASAEVHDVVLGSENMEYYSLEGGKLLRGSHFGRTRLEVIKILQAVNRPNLRLTYDVGYANLTEEGPNNFCKDVVSFIVNVHVNDNDGRSDLHGAIGSGNIDFRGVFKVLVNEGYSGAIIVELPYDERLVSDIRKVRGLLVELDALD